ncbi:prolipoprotein diacylglyceryl transferase [Clostridium cylindrosporum]|uniref:Phosphatidylglycerol--prolipoprotein diacylglyceryl transferase n=1 Tax=Clostridium cylindrosporum DSM 605 TaxID=1121307 RepID=A0A0J8G2Z5_CLOCY|nr:prolipoprotein diacylglyceryl transferase [Clostridium cylindrosporum]KMT22071.1 prolipoprotein diacylglyceryl transferase Lgt [Clostridium cylindrosporum DSM 605]
MNPVAFTILGLEVRWYGILISFGMILGLLIAVYTAKVRKVNYDNILDGLIIAIPVGILGARLYYVLFNLSYYLDNPGDIINIRQGGLAIHGGIIFGLLAAYIFCRYKKYDFLALLDVVAPSIIIAQALGRWGNFFNMEAHGGPVTKEFISQFPEFIQRGMYIGGTYYHPTFLYESIWNILVFCILMYLIHRVHTKGVIFFTYFGLYSIGRFFIEGLRTDSLMVMGLRTAQMVSLIGIILWIGYLVYAYKVNRR